MIMENVSDTHATINWWNKDVYTQITKITGNVCDVSTDEKVARFSSGKAVE